MENKGQNVKAEGSREEVKTPEEQHQNDPATKAAEAIQDKAVEGEEKLKQARSVSRPSEENRQEENSLAQKVQEEIKALDFDFTFKDGKLVITATHEGTIGGLGLTGFVTTDALLDRLEKLIPGDWDKAPIAALRVLINNMNLFQKEMERKAILQEEQHNDTKISHTENDQVVKGE